MPQIIVPVTTGTHSCKQGARQQDISQAALLEEPVLKELLQHPQLWRANELGYRPENNLGTGFKSLDELLWGDGWPRSGLMELLCDSPGLGELRLLLPALKQLSQEEERWLVWVNPPHIPYAPALSSLGVDTSRVLLIHPKNHADALWALEQALKSGTCSAALAWLDEDKLTNSAIRRLQLAATQGETWATLFRPTRAATAASMAELRLRVTPDADIQSSVSRICLEITKRRGGWPVESFSLTLKHSPLRCQASEFNQKLARWRKRNLKPCSSLTEKNLQAGQAAANNPRYQAASLALLP